jgi:hypothetical protein
LRALSFFQSRRRFVFRFIAAIDLLLVRVSGLLGQFLSLNVEIVCFGCVDFWNVWFFGSFLMFLLSVAFLVFFNLWNLWFVRFLVSEFLVYMIFLVKKWLICRIFCCNNDWLDKFFTRTNQRSIFMLLFMKSCISWVIKNQERKSCSLQKILVKLIFLKFPKIFMLYSRLV